MKYQEYADFIDNFQKSSLTRLTIEEENFKISMEKEMGTATAKPEQTCTEEEQEDNCADNLCRIKAPLVGVFYAAPSPEAPPFVKTGQQVDAGQVLCIIEAMKMMNELKSPVSGTVKTIGGINGRMVEYGQILFEMEPC